MNNSNLKFGNNSVSNNQSIWNIDTIANEIFKDLNGTVNLSVIQETLKEIIPRYESARIKTYVPIFIRRNAMKQLQTRQAPLAALEMEINQS